LKKSVNNSIFLLEKISDRNSELV